MKTQKPVSHLPKTICCKANSTKKNMCYRVGFLLHEMDSGSMNSAQLQRNPEGENPAIKAEPGVAQ